VEEAGTVEEE
jgi:hypothetical protein